MDKLDNKMKRTIKKFDEYIQNTSICRYFIIITVLLAIFIIEIIV